MAKKGMKNWFGFGKKEAEDTHENETSVNNEDIPQGNVIDSIQTDSAQVSNTEITETDVEVIETAIIDNTEARVIDETRAETAETDSVDIDAPKWYQFGKKKQSKQDTEQAETEAQPQQTIDEIDEQVTDVVVTPTIIADEVQTTAKVIETTPVIDTESTPVTEVPAVINERADDVVNEEPKDKFFTRLKRGLSRTKGNIGSGFKNFFRGKHIDDELFEELEEQLLIADLGVATTTRIIDNLTQQASRKELKNAEALYDILKKDMAEMLHKVEQPLEIDSNNKPHVILMVGVNGVGKTTTIGKMAKKFQGEGKSVMLAAGDTFRAAAVEQLQVWGDRNGIPVVAQHTGADSASVLFDAMQSATAKDVDVLIADTAGRLQNKAHLMEELKKVVRVMKKHDATAPHEIMLTIDAGTGQNALSQAELFKEAVGLTGITLTKLDGTAKGGVIFAVADKFQIPIRFIGIGEGIDDLRTFNSEEFIDALFSTEEQK
ncbi:signal recognition particle-docking protein FtsY [Moritella viscosa]|uniref:Signal recognition particle receptor FtsY n=1 Tax=Moritella viscosa TaxID=80854 RepID=A0ABY1HD08_9GAMM|nr:signal recognition particle-docking protein FtsY [Moritella viscosa]CED62029.1 cell division protein FtsY [Moritella viscosa]SGY91947.1 Signal recognition particle-docking protein FtsY [Moritella viscosa]SGY96300.1 Signal recognition particle-docking protein FtsY [Moritella viscosa]SGZ02324.1 Signal recognition particle-docking protein FtsY [Moritella viscosa]SHO07999.1 Signal recognition particle-docking protein FtsY [Moritella viscosa]